MIKRILIVLTVVAILAGMSYYSYQEGLYTGAQVGYEYGVAVTNFERDLADVAKEAARESCPRTCSL